jgi:HAMP domain-containing protein
MKKTLSISLNYLIILLLIPSILLTLIVIAHFTYNSLYTTILKGFDKKLFAISTVTAAFIDGDEHDQILAIKKLNSINYDNNSKKIYALNLKNKIFTVDETNGAAFNGPNIKFSDLDIKEITFNSKNNLLYAMDNRKQALICIEPQSGKTAIIHQFPIICDAITCSNKQNKLIATGRYASDLDSKNDLLSISLHTGDIEHLGTLNHYNVDCLCINDNASILYGIDNHINKLIIINLTLSDMAVEALVTLKFKSTNKEIDQPIKDITYNEHTDQILGLTDRLVSIDIKTGIVDDQKYVKGFRNEMGTLYLKYVQPMRKIREKLGLTFVYTQKLTDTPHLDVEYDILKQKRVAYNQATQIIYVIDSNVDENHTAIGYADTTPADKQIRDVLFKGSVYLSEIKDWEEWGLLKSGFAAIKNSKKEIKAIAGADINVSIITDKTRIAMLKVTFVAIIALLLVTYISLLISKKIISPIQQLKEVALGIAAGHYGKHIKIDKPLELADLSKSFNLMSDSLEQTHENIEQTNFQHEKNRKQKEMIRSLREVIENEYDDISITSFAKADNRGYGWTRWNHMVVAWITKSTNYDDDVRRSSILSLILNKYIEFYSGDWDKVAHELENLFCDSVQAFFCIDLNKNKMHSLLRNQFNLCFIHENGIQIDDLKREVVLEKDTIIWIFNDFDIEALKSESNIPLNIDETKEFLSHKIQYMDNFNTASILMKI